MRILWVFVMMIAGTVQAEELVKAPNSKASPINQRRAYGNACGPASLLNAFQYGSAKWQKAFDAVPGKDSRTRLRYVVGTWGNRPSHHIKGRKRWNAKEGVNLLDLTDMANEMRRPHFLPKIKQEVLTRKSRESAAKLIARSHKRITESLSKGLPPILCIRRFAHRYSKEVGGKSWWPIRAHFVVVIEVPKKLPRKATSYKIKYVDPYGGFIREGVIHTNTGGFINCPFLATSMPKTEVGKSFVKRGEESLLTFSAIVGAW